MRRFTGCWVQERCPTGGDKWDPKTMPEGLPWRATGCWPGWETRSHIPQLKGPCTRQLKQIANQRDLPDSTYRVLESFPKLCMHWFRVLAPLGEAGTTGSPTSQVNIWGTGHLHSPAANADGRGGIWTQAVWLSSPHSPASWWENSVPGRWNSMNKRKKFSYLVSK